jgi:hypothetical protein
MGRGYAIKTNGECVHFWERNNANFFKTINTHITFGSFTGCPNGNSGIYGCKGNRFFANTPGIEPIPPSMMPTGVAKGPVYGKSKNTILLKTRSTQELVYFDSSSWDLIKPRQRCPIYPGQTSARLDVQGPAFSNAHAICTLSRKMADQNNYVNRLDHNFVDGYSLPYDPENKPKPKCGEEDSGYTNKWLIFTHPATNLYTSIPEPFKIKDYYEESGSVPSQNPNYGGINFMPFCQPLSVYNYDKSKYFGQYLGLTFVIIFGQNAHAFPVKRYLPDNYYITEPNPPKIDPTKALHGLELWAFWTASSPGLGSPLIGKIRFWFHSMAPGKETDGEGRDWIEPFMINFSSTTISAASENVYVLDSRVINQNTITPLNLNLSGLQVFVTY